RGRVLIGGILITNTGRHAYAVEFTGIAEHRAPVVAGFADRRREHEPIEEGGAIPPDEFGTALVGGGGAPIPPRYAPVLIVWPTRQEPPVAQDDGGAGARRNPCEVDGRDRAGTVVAADGHAAQALVLDPPRGPARVAEVGVGILGVKRPGGRPV